MEGKDTLGNSKMVSSTHRVASSSSFCRLLGLSSMSQAAAAAAAWTCQVCAQKAQRRVEGHQ